MAMWPFGRKNPSTSPSPEVQRILKGSSVSDDEAAQNNALPETSDGLSRRAPRATVYQMPLVSSVGRLPIQSP